MVNREMKFLNVGRLIGRHTNANIGQGLEFSASRPGQGNDRDISSPGNFGRPANICRVSGGAQRSQYIAGPSQRQQQLGKNIFGVNIIAERGGQRRKARQRDDWERPLQPIGHFRRQSPPHGN